MECDLCFNPAVWIEQMGSGLSVNQQIWLPTHPLKIYKDCVGNQDRL